MKICWCRMRKTGQKLNSWALRAQNWLFVVAGNFDDNDIVVNKENCLGCSWFFAIFEINKKLNYNGNFINISKA